MKSIVIKSYGGVDKLIYAEIEKPNVCEGEVLIRIKAAGVNPVDCKIRKGLLKSRMKNEFPITLGWDFSGIVVDTGYSAKRFKPADEVYGYARRMKISQGTYAEYIVLPESYVVHKPSNISFDEAASVPLAGLTAFQALFDKGKMVKHQKVLILGASGGVGSFAIQFAKIKGAEVYALAGPDREEYLKDLGADYIFDYSDKDWDKKYLEILPEKADIVLDFVGQDVGKKAYELTKEKGTLVSVINQPDVDIANKLNINVKYLFVEPDSIELDKIRDWIEKNKIKINIDKTFELKDAAQAHQYIEKGHTLGKVILRIP
jgi:NADPH:quinone reductase-like Zn-dependent oxidoreductase